MSLKRLLMASTIALLWIAGSADAQQYPKTVLRFAHFVPATLPGATVDQWFADELAKRTSGQITMQIFWAESMGKSMELLKMASQGGVDIAATAAGYFPSQIPMLAGATIPFAKSAKQAKTVWTTLYDETPALQDEARRAGVMPLLWHPIPTYHLIGRAPVQTLDDLKASAYAASARSSHGCCVPSERPPSRCCPENGMSRSSGAASTTCCIPGTPS
jgi:TRAP-type transport system periplasmic protein